MRTASRLFYAEGIRAVGVERLITEASVTRATFYRHFPGKDDLVVAYLKATAEGIKDAVERARGDKSPREAVRAVIDDQRTWLFRTLRDLLGRACGTTSGRRPGSRGNKGRSADAACPKGRWQRRVIRGRSRS
ncbi:TetR/AcrR family transcriptional regulator [Nonomuraea sp. NPDC050022]|uniref:TetR/AcrR family transcriptional regulator n=1 Tax=unclassified Nonomuraea TaxID=2593643 RepID=UPI003403D65F